LKLLLQPMAVNGIEATGSMGADTPLAVLSKRPQPLFNYFKQLFAQVTNPPIDPIREEVVMDEGMMLGGEGNLLDETPEHCHRLRVPRPILTNEELEKISNVNVGNLKSITLDILFKPSDGESRGTEEALEELFRQADEALDQSDGVILDATFITQSLRRQATEVAARHNLTFVILQTDCPQEVSIRRILSRTKDNYESNALTEEAYLNNKKRFEAVDLDDLKGLYPNLSIIHLIVDTRYDSPEEWYIISVEKR